MNDIKIKKNICAEHKCTGCMACYNICRAGAINMLADVEGFVRPVIDPIKCTNCHLCSHICPANDKILFKSESPVVYSGWSTNDEIRLKSSSGGIFSELALSVLNSGGVVIGAGMSQMLTVEHLCISEANELNKLQGSKYVQSYIGDTYRRIRDYLLLDKIVLFSGTPCQVDGLNKYLGKEYDSLITVDLICHGVPSPKIFEDYKNYISKKYNINAVSMKFRSKRYNWPFYQIEIQDTLGTKYYGKYYEDPWIRGFLREYFLRPSCSECQYTNIQRVGDITLGDWWGYKPQRNKKDHSYFKKGVSLILVNSEKGNQLLSQCKPNMIVRERTIDDAVKTNRSLYAPFPASSQRKNFWQDYNNFSFSDLISKYMYPEKDLVLHTRILSGFPYNRITSFISKVALVLEKIFDNDRSLSEWMKRKFNEKIIDTLFVKREQSRLIKQIQSNCDKTIYLFSNPIHSNLGDQAQTYCILQWFKENYSAYKVICAPKRSTPIETLKLIHEKLKPDDLLFVHSGYLIFDPHPELPYICDIVNMFKDRRIVILPQTINLVQYHITNRVKKVFNEHPHLVLMCRDEVSYLKAEMLFPNCRLFLWPDFVTSLIGKKSYKNDKRNGIMFCLRNDGEKFYSNEKLNMLKNKFSGVRITTYDTTVLNSAYSWKYRRNSLIEQVFEKFSKYQVIITDRYHGTIFSQITSTPVVVLSSADHKLSSGVKWFPQNLFGKNVFFAKNLDEAYVITQDILKRNGKIIENLPYFKENYFSKLQYLLENKNYEV